MIIFSEEVTNSWKKTAGNLFAENGCFHKKTDSEIIYSGRNILTKIEIEGISSVIKSFAVPSFLRKIIYSYRSSKANRSFENAKTIIAKGFITPKPLAFVEYKKKGFLDKSFYICEHHTYSYMMRAILNSSKSNNCFLSIGVWIAGLHEQGIHHLDLTPGNILINEKDGEYFFALVDCNRIKFGKMELYDCINNIIQTGVRSKNAYTLLSSYCKKRNLNIKEIISLFSLIKKRYRAKWFLKNKTRPWRRAFSKG